MGDFHFVISLYPLGSAIQMCLNGLSSTPHFSMGITWGTFRCLFILANFICTSLISSNLVLQKKRRGNEVSLIGPGLEEFMFFLCCYHIFLKKNKVFLDSLCFLHHHNYPRNPPFPFFQKVIPYEKITFFREEKNNLINKLINWESLKACAPCNTWGIFPFHEVVSWAWLFIYLLCSPACSL